MQEKNLPYGGELTTLSAMRTRLQELCKRKPELPDANILLSIPGFHTDFDNVLVFEGDTILQEDLLLDSEKKWIRQNRISIIVCFGNLTINGDLINNDEQFWPLLAVAGDLSACNILKGGMPLLVWGNLSASGYIIPEYNDGPLRVGKDLSSLGYVPRCKDQPQARGHHICGKVSGFVLDARQELKAKDLRRLVIPEAMNHGWFNLSTVFAFGSEGKSIWRDSPLPEEQKQPTEQIEAACINHADPTKETGHLAKASEMLEQLCAKISEKILYDPASYSYPESFAEFVKAQLNQYPNENVLVLEPGTIINGDLVLDWQESWVKENAVCAIYCAGDLEINGDLLNRMLEGGVLLLVAGDLRVDNLFKGGATVMVLGSLLSKGLVIGEYNDGVLRIGGDLSAGAYLLFDHDGFVRGKIQARCGTDDELVWNEVLKAELFDEEEDFHPNVDKIRAYQKAGKGIWLQADPD